MEFAAFLAPGPYVDSDHPLVRAEAHRLAEGAVDASDIVARCFAFVRDEVVHSADARRNPVTCRASDVLLHRTGYCYAKSHLLAALLRVHGIPAALCYQRLSVGDENGPLYCLHGLNAVYLEAYGWYRLDARGNKPGVDARFAPPVERLAFRPRGDGERDLDGRFAEPLPQVVAALEACVDVADVLAHLPDVDPARAAFGAAALTEDGSAASR